MLSGVLYSELHPVATSQRLDVSSLARVLPTAELASVSLLEAVVAQLAPPSAGAASYAAAPLAHYACAVQFLAVAAASLSQLMLIPDLAPEERYGL